MLYCPIAITAFTIAQSISLPSGRSLTKARSILRDIDRQILPAAEGRITGAKSHERNRTAAFTQIRKPGNRLFRASINACSVNSMPISAGLIPRIVDHLQQLRESFH